MPPTRVAISGLPAAAASSTTYGKDSMRDGITMTRPSVCASRAGIGGRKWISPESRSRSTWSCNWAASGPPPARAGLGKLARVGPAADERGGDLAAVAPEQGDRIDEQIDAFQRAQFA